MKFPRSCYTSMCSLPYGGTEMIPKLNEYKERWHIKSDHAIKPGLTAIKEALNLLGNPEKLLNVIHVTGTNGKGSTIRFMESILERHGFSTGVFSSPALIDIHDQIRLNGNPITPKELDATFQTMKGAGVGDQLTDFELLTVAAFVTFQKAAPDYVLIETGMGGLLDSTNVVQPIVTVITSVALDHAVFLGERIEEVANHKAGIIKKDVPVVVGKLPGEALKVIQKTAERNKAHLKRYGEHFTVENKEPEIFKGEQSFTLRDRKMKGAHQKNNMAIAIETLLTAGVELDENHVQEAIASAQLPYRFEEVFQGVIFDGAHNPAAAAALVQTIQEAYPGEKVNFFIGMLKGKDIEGTLNELIPVAASFTFLSFNHPDAAAGEELMERCHHPRKSVTMIEGESIILSNASSNKRIVTGSLYLISGLKIV